MHCQTFCLTDKLNVWLRIRNKEGVKVYSWGTLNQDITNKFDYKQNDIFWMKKFEEKQDFFVDFQCQCALGKNLYEIQVAVSYEETPNYMGQEILHWVDEAAFFQVMMNSDEYHFGGTSDLKMKALWG